MLVDFENGDPVQAVREATDGRGVDEAIECSGAAGTFRQGVEMVRKGGSVVLLGVPPDHVHEPLPFKYVVHNEIAIYGSRANPNVSRKVISLIGAGQLKVGDLVTHTFPLENFATALDTFVNGGTARSRSWSSRTDVRRTPHVMAGPWVKCAGASCGAQSTARAIPR